jgi:hypothetical protein
MTIETLSIDLPVLPASIAQGAMVTYTFDTAKNTSESGVSGRKAMRDQVIRNYMVSIAPGPDALEFQNILLAIRGQRYPLAMRDWSSYKLNNELLAWSHSISPAGSTIAPLRKLFQPGTGAFYYYQRILIPDESEVSLSFTINGSPLPGGVVATIYDPGYVSLNTSLSPGDQLKVSGQYLIPVCLVDNPSGTIIRGKPSQLMSFDSLRLEEILEAELIALAT